MTTLFAQIVEDEDGIPDEIQIITEQKFEELKSKRKVYEFAVKPRPEEPSAFAIRQDIHLVNARISAPLDPQQPWLVAARFIPFYMNIPIKRKHCAKIVNFLLENEGSSAFILQ